MAIINDYVSQFKRVIMAKDLGLKGPSLNFYRLSRQKTHFDTRVLYTLFIVEIKTGKMPNNIGPTVNNMLKGKYTLKSNFHQL